MGNQITQKQRNFCNEYVKSGSPVDAYIATYNTESRNVASVEANRLLNKTEVQSYIDELMKPIEYDAQINKQQQINFIKERISICIENNDESSVIKYTDMLNKIYGYYKDNSGDNKDNHNILNQLSVNDIKCFLGKE